MSDRVDTYDPLIHEVHATARMGANPSGSWVKVSDYYAAVRRATELTARVQVLEAENARLNMEMAAYRPGCTPKDAAAMLSAIDALEAEKAARTTQSTPSLASETTGEQPITRLHARIAELEAALRIIGSYTGHDSAAWAAKEIARGALATDKGDPS